MSLSKKHIIGPLQDVYSEALGVKISKEKAWEIFKLSIQTPFVKLIDNYNEAGAPELIKGDTVDELVMSLAGVGRFEIIMAGARKSKSRPP